MLKSAQKSQHIEWVTFVAMLKYELPNCTPAKFSHSRKIKKLNDQINKNHLLINRLLLLGSVLELVWVNLLVVGFVDVVIGVRIVEKSTKKKKKVY